MSIGKTRGFLYWLARILGDVNAVQKGKVGKRIAYPSQVKDRNQANFRQRILLTNRKEAHPKAA